MKELPAKSVLRLECTCVHANKACNASFKDRLWLFLLRRDFGDGNFFLCMFFEIVLNEC